VINSYEVKNMAEKDNDKIVHIDGKPERRGVDRMKYKGYDGSDQEIDTVQFVGCDGTKYQVSIRENMVFVNGAEMLSWKDKPCEYASREGLRRCGGANEHCSYLGRDLPEGCTFYEDKKELDEEREKFKKEQEQKEAIVKGSE
jgi:hypothetical protein